jgi:A/G-specific adenine glycosylase
MSKTVTASSQRLQFAEHIVAWQKVHGRNDLPWQNTQDPYRVWLSEIMLQQTQVVTVMGYFDRFLQRLPNVQALAAASLDDVMGLWSGLGYYSRARNLHRCAQAVVDKWGGIFPKTALELQQLPGIGPSTAAAISSLCFGERVAILDANVKRVLTRVLGFDGDLALASQERHLWSAAAELLPNATKATIATITMPRYTQGMMDLGATLCLPKNPVCTQCPVMSQCLAHSQGNPQRYPVKTRKIKRSSQTVYLLWAHTERGDVFLSQRPAPGVWAGLFCFPWFDSEASLVQAIPEIWRERLEPVHPFLHVLTHKDLHLHPWRLRVDVGAALDDLSGTWVSSQQWPDLGLPAPVRKLLLGD